MSQKCVVFWFRRDLRLSDNAGLSMALGSGARVLPVFIFDKNILDPLEKDDKRVSFIYQALKSLHAALREFGSGVLMEYGTPLEAFERICERYSPAAVYTNHDYEPYAAQRDNLIRGFLENKGIDFNTSKDQVLFEKDEIVADSGKPYTIFTPYSRKWLDTLSCSSRIKTFHCSLSPENLIPFSETQLRALDSIGFREQPGQFTPPALDESRIRSYTQLRDMPALNATSHMSVHLRFGTVSIRRLIEKALELDRTWLTELIWREFFMQILWHFPAVVETSFKKQYDRIQWLNRDTEFNRWCEGKTGFPLVDAGMRELNSTGFMHNRVRMVTAGFLVKHLLIDWRWGETYFATKLLDYDLSANNGNWQWAAGCGCDAAPYFRIFNPVSQAEKFDPEKKYIRKWIPEYGTAAYPVPMVDHKMARERCLEAYRVVSRG